MLIGRIDLHEARKLCDRPTDLFITRIHLPTRTHTRTYASKHARTHSSSHTRTCTQTHAHKHARTHAHIHTHTNTYNSCKKLTNIYWQAQICRLLRYLNNYEMFGCVMYVMVTNNQRAPYGVYFIENSTIVRRPYGVSSAAEQQQTTFTLR